MSKNHCDLGALNVRIWRMFLQNHGPVCLFLSRSSCTFSAPGLQHKVPRLRQDRLNLRQRAHQRHSDPLPLARQRPRRARRRHQPHEGGGRGHLLHLVQDDHAGLRLLPGGLQGAVRGQGRQFQRGRGPGAQQPHRLHQPRGR